MGQILAPDNLPDLVIASTTTITMATSYLGRSTRITVGGQQYLYSSVITLNFATTGINGLDTGAIAANTLYYIYAVTASGVPGLIASLAAPGTGPTGFTSWKEVGRCRTLQSAATLAQITNRLGGTSLTSMNSEWANFTPSITWVVNTNTGQWRHVANVVYVENKIALTGTPPGGAGVNVTPPPNLTIDAFTLSVANTIIGMARLTDTSAGLSYVADLVATSSVVARIRYFTADGSGILDNNNTNNSPFIWASGDFMVISYSFPAAELAGLYT